MAFYRFKLQGAYIGFIKGGCFAAFCLMLNLPVLADDNIAPNDLYELQVKASYSEMPASDVQGGTGYSIDTLFFSPVIQNNWRIFAGEYHAHEDEPDGEGNMSFWRSTAGVEYHDGGVKLSLAPTLNYYNNAARAGVTGNGQWSLNDHWAIGAESQIFSVDTPLRALNAGITSNSYSANAMWHQGDERSVTMNVAVMNFSDQNLRDTGNALYSERLYTNAGSSFTLDGVVNITESQNSLDEQRLYFNPKTDLLSSAGLKATDVLCRDGDSVYLQSLQLLPGSYWQRNYGESMAFNARYELRAHFSDNFEVGLGGDFTRQEADGIQASSMTALFDLTRKF